MREMYVPKFLSKFRSFLQVCAKRKLFTAAWPPRVTSLKSVCVVSFVIENTMLQEQIQTLRFDLNRCKVIQNEEVEGGSEFSNLMCYRTKLMVQNGN